MYMKSSFKRDAAACPADCRRAIRRPIFCCPPPLCRAVCLLPATCNPPLTCHPLLAVRHRATVPPYYRAACRLARRCPAFLTLQHAHCFRLFLFPRFFPVFPGSFRFFPAPFGRGARKSNGASVVRMRRRWGNMPAAIRGVSRFPSECWAWAPAIARAGRRVRILREGTRSC